MFVPSLISLANGGAIVSVNGVRYFVLEPVLQHQMSLVGRVDVPGAFLLEPQWCNRTAPFAPTLGGHYTGAPIGNYCHPEYAQPYTELWRDVNRNPPYVI